MTTKTRVHALADALRADPRGILPPDVPAGLADRLFDAVVAGADRETLRAACGDTEIANGYRRERLGDSDFAELRSLVRGGRSRINKIAADIATLEAERAELNRLLTRTS